jgi:hypothetical protein
MKNGFIVKKLVINLIFRQLLGPQTGVGSQTFLTSTVVQNVLHIEFANLPDLEDIFCSRAWRSRATRKT